MSNLLFLTQILPYPLAGGAKIRAYYVLRQLAQKHHVTLVSFTRDDDRSEAVDHLRQICHAVHTVPIARSRLRDAWAVMHSALSGRPAVIVRDRMPAMEALLARLIRETALAAAPFVAAHADQTAMAQYALFARSQQPDLRLVLDQHNALFQLVRRQADDERSAWRRRLWHAEARRLVRYETELCRQFDHVFTVSEVDRQTLLGLLPPAEAATAAARFTAVPICVDPAAEPALTPVPGSHQVIFLGTMFWPPNIEGVLWFAEEVLPRVVAQRPEAHFVIAGKNPPPAVKKLAEPGSPLYRHITVTGFVADPRPLLSESALFVVPLKAGGGMRVKIVDAWQWGLPVVSTTIGAEGLEIRPGENILIADDPEAFATAVLGLLSDPGLAQSLRVNGRRWVEERYDWRTVYRQFDGVYNELLHQV
jgi:polysaccharide biosynthesis protein PslH